MAGSAHLRIYQALCSLGNRVEPPTLPPPHPQGSGVCWHPLLALRFSHFLFQTALQGTGTMSFANTAPLARVPARLWSTEEGAQLHLLFSKITSLAVPSHHGIYKFSSSSSHKPQENWTSYVRDNTDSRAFLVQTPLRKKFCPK